MKTNKEKLPMQSLYTKVDHPRVKGYYTGYDGIGRMLPGTGAITYNVQIGDNCIDIVGDHIEPGVTMANPNPAENAAVQLLACIGNEVTILSGPLAGQKGIVTGTHGGVDHTMAWFAPEIIQQMNGKEDFLIKAIGQGLESDLAIEWMNIDPLLFDLLDFKEEKGKLKARVAAIIPGYLMGAGLGVSTLKQGDIDLMSQDKEEMEKLGLNNLRYGDLVYISNLNSSYGPHFKKGAGSLGFIVHSDSFSSGHGPGITMIASDPEGLIEPVLDESANLIHFVNDLQRNREA